MTEKNINNGDPATILQRAFALHQAGQLDEAAQLYRAVLQHYPKNADVLHFLGMIINQKGEYDESCRLIGAAVDLMSMEPRKYANHYNAINNYGNALRSSGRLDEAVRCYEKVLVKEPERPDVHNNLGNALRDLDQLSAAINSFDRAIELQPAYADAYANRGNALRGSGRLDEAVRDYRRAIELNPNHAGAHSNLGAALLAKGCFAEGWKENEWRWNAHGWQQRVIPCPTWDGGDLSDMTILVCAEQGVGDEIMFASCIPDLVKRARQVILECDLRLQPLFARSLPMVMTHAGNRRDISSDWLSGLPDVDRHIYAGSLPLHLRKARQSFPTHNGYLTADTDAVEKWQQRLMSVDSNLKIGISWRGGNDRQKRQRRSLQLADWKPILDTAGCTFINLQYGDCRQEIDRARVAGIELLDWPESDPLTDLDDFAALITNLDLVISVDNSTVHMAGALGIPCWVLQPAAPDWRWLAGAQDSYWYPRQVNHFQDRLGHWESVVREIALELQQWKKDRQPA